MRTLREGVGVAVGDRVADGDAEGVGDVDGDGESSARTGWIDASTTIDATPIPFLEIVKAEDALIALLCTVEMSRLRSR